MNSIKTYQDRLRAELAAVDNEIKGHNEQIELLAKRIEGLKRALELFDSDQSAIAELLRTSDEATIGSSQMPEVETQASAKVLMAKASPRSAARTAKGTSDPSSTPGRELGASAQKAALKYLDEIRAANQSGKVKRPDLIAAVLQNTPGLTNQEIIAVLKKEFSWDCKENNLTGHLYTHPERFTHTPRDRSGKNPPRWSVK